MSTETRDALREALAEALREPEPGWNFHEYTTDELADAILAHPAMVAALRAMDDPDLACTCANGDGTTAAKYHAKTCPIRRATDAPVAEGLPTCDDHTVHHGACWKCLERAAARHTRA